MSLRIFVSAVCRRYVRLCRERLGTKREMRNGFPGYHNERLTLLRHFTRPIDPGGVGDI